MATFTPPPPIPVEEEEELEGFTPPPPVPVEEQTNFAVDPSGKPVALPEGEQVQDDPLRKYNLSSSLANEFSKRSGGFYNRYNELARIPVAERSPETIQEMVNTFNSAKEAELAFYKERNKLDELRPKVDRVVAENKRQETEALEKMREDIVLSPLVDSFLEAKNRRDQQIAELQAQNLPPEEYNKAAKEVIDNYTSFVRDTEKRVKTEDEENATLLNSINEDMRRVRMSGGRRIGTAEAISNVFLGASESERLASLAKDMGPEYVNEIISRTPSLRDKARGVVSAAMESGALEGFGVFDAIGAGIEAITTGPDAAADKAYELQELRKRAGEGDTAAQAELKKMEDGLTEEALNKAIRELPVEEQMKIRRDYINKKREEKLGHLPEERKQQIIDASERMMRSYEASRFDPDSPEALGTMLPNGTVAFTPKGKMDIDKSIDTLVEAGNIPEERADYLKSYYNGIEEAMNRANRGAAMETNSFKKWLNENPEYVEEIKTDEGAEKALNAYEESHNTVLANAIDLVVEPFKGIKSYIDQGTIGARYAAVAASDLSDEEKADKMFEIYSEEFAKRQEEEPKSFLGGVANVTGSFAAQAILPISLKFLSMWKPAKPVANALQPVATAFNLAQMAATYGAQGYTETVDQAIRESGFASIEEIQEQNPKLAEQINQQGINAMIDAAKISVSEQIPIEAIVTSIVPKIGSPSKMKRTMQAVAFAGAEMGQEYISNVAMQSAMSRYNMENKDIKGMSLEEMAQVFLGVLPITGATAIGARMADVRREKLDAIAREMDAEALLQKEAAEASAKAAERAAQLAPESSAALMNAANETLDSIINDADASAAERAAGKTTIETRTIADSVRDKDTFQYQGMRGALTQEEGEVVFREFGTQSKYIVPVAPDQTLAEIEELEWVRKGQKRQVAGEPIEPTAVPDRPSLVEPNPIVSQENFDAAQDEIQVPEALLEIEKSPILNKLADLFDTGDSIASQQEKMEYKTGKRKGETYTKPTQKPVAELPEYYRQATPEQLGQARRLVDSALRLIDTIDTDEATKDQLAEHFLLLDQDITNYEQHPEYKKYRQERGWKVSTIGETGEVPTTATELEAADRELEQRVRAEIESRERARNVAQRKAITPPETPQGSRVKAAAYVAPDGTIYEADSHLNAMQKAVDAGKITQNEVIKKQKATSRETPEFGYSTEAEPFVTRDQAETLAKASGQILVETPETGRLHSNEVALDDFNPDIDAPPYIARAIVNKEPISVEDVDRAGVDLPKGWGVDGDLYVFKGAESKEVKPIKGLDVFDRIYAYVQDFVEKNPKSEETLRNKAGLIAKTLNSKDLFKFPSVFQDAVIDGINNRLLSALRRGVEPKDINAGLIAKSAFSDAKKTYPKEYERTNVSLQAESQTGKKLEDVLSGKISEAEGELTPDQKKTLEQTKRRTDAITRKLEQKKMRERIVSDFEETLNNDERLAFEYVKATERSNNDPKNKSKRRQADAARQILEDNVEDYEQIVRSVVQRFAELAERISGQELTPKAPEVTASGQAVATEQENKRNVLAEVDAELAKTEDLTEDERAARDKTEDPNVNTVGAWAKTITDPKLKKFIGFILKNSPDIADIPIRYVSGISGSYDGFFDPNEGGRIVMPLRPTKDVNLLIAHEMVHGATLEKSRFYDNREFDKLTKGELRIFKELDKIRNSLIAELGKGNQAFSELMSNADAAQRALDAAQLVADRKIGGELYALTNMGEFLANVIDNPEFQKALDTIDPNIFRQIWNFIRQLFYGDRAPSVGESAIWEAIFELSKTTKIGAEVTPAPSFKLPDYGIEGLPVLEGRSDLNALIDEAVAKKKITAEDAIALKTAIKIIPEEGYRGAQVLLTDRLTREQSRALSMGVYDFLATRGLADVVQNAPVIFINTSKAKRDVARTFIHENAHLIMDHVLTENDLNKARDIYDSLPITRQALYTAQYGWGGDTGFAEWFAESMADYYERKLAEAGIDIATDETLFNGIYKKIVDLFSNERSRVDAFFDGFESSIARANQEIARQVEAKLVAPAAITPETDPRKMKPEDYADRLAAMTQEERDNVDTYENSKGYKVFLARELIKKVPVNSSKFKKITDTGMNFVLQDEWDFVANVDGTPYGLIKEEDPDDEELRVWAFGKIGTNDFVETIYNVGFENEVVKEMQKDLAKKPIAPAAVRIPPDEGGNLPPVTSARLEELGVRADETQIVGTKSTYDNILKQIAQKGISILDFGSGLGHGLKLMKDNAKKMGFNVIGFEPMWNPDKKGAVQAPDYIGFESLALIPDNSQDYIINNAVLNVVDQDTRATIVKQMYDKLKAGGTMFVQARAFKGDVERLMKNPQNIVVGPREFFVPSKQTFQKGFLPDELIGFVESQLPDAKVVRTQFGGVGIAVTKPQAIAPAIPKMSKVSDEYDASRVGTATQGAKPTTQETNVTIETVDDKRMAEQVAELDILNYVGGVPVSLPKSITSIKDPKKKRDAFINFAVDNLLALYNAFPEELRAVASRWYDGARKIADNIAKEYGITSEQAAGILAAFSPRKDWFQNIELGIQFAKVFKNHLKTKITKRGFAEAIKAITDSATGEGAGGRADILAMLDGRSIDGLWNEAARNEARANKLRQTQKLAKERFEALPELQKAAELRELAAWAVRVIATQEYGLEYNVYSPDGDILRKQTTKTGRPRVLVWQSTDFIKKALSIGYDGSQKNISDNLGEQHKIRSFYNNIIAPNSPYGDVTVDTHAVNAATLFPMGGTGKMVLDAFGEAGVAGGGNSGTYWLFHEAYRRAAAKVGIQPRQMQSITWEAVRLLFPDGEKRKQSFVEKFANIWKNSPNVESARKKIVSEGIGVPDWASAYTGDAGGTTEAVARARGASRSKANTTTGLRNRIRSGDYGIAPAAIDPNATPDPDSQDNTPNEAAELSRARADAKVAQESVVGHSILEDEIPEELREELEATYKNGMTFEEFVNPDTISLNQHYYPYAVATWLDLNGGLMPTTKTKETTIEKLPEGTAEQETVRMLKRAFDIYDNASATTEGKEVTYKIGEIATTWLRSGLGEAALRNAIIQFTNLNVPSAVTIAEDIVKQYEIQKRIADSRDRARIRMDRALPAVTARQSAEKERMIRLEEAAGTIDSIAEAIKAAYGVNLNKARVDRATEKKQIEEQLRVAKRIIREVVPRAYLGTQLTTLEKAAGIDGLRKVVEAAQDALNRARVDTAVSQARKAFDKAAKSVRAGTLTPEAEAILKEFVDRYTKTGMSDETRKAIEKALEEYQKDPINALKNVANDKYLRRKGQLNAIKIDASIGLDALREISAIVGATLHMDKMAKGEMLFNKKLKRDELKARLIEEIGRIKTITKEEKGFGPKLGGFKWNAIFKGARVENILRGLGLENMRKFIYEDLTLDAYNDELRNRIGLKKKIEEAVKQFTGLEVGSKDYDKYSKETFQITGVDQSGNRTTLDVRRTELIDMVASLRDANNFKKAVRAGGYVIDRLRGASNGDTIEITPESYTQIQSMLTQADMDMVNFIVGLYNNDLFTLLNDASIQAYGHGIKKSDGVYYPRNAFEWDRVTETSKDLDYMEYYNARVDSVGHLKERVDETNARLVAVDFLSRLDYHVTNDSRIGAYLPIVQDINSVLRDSAVMRPLENKVGRDVVFQIREMVRQQTVPLPGLRDGIINTLVGNAGVGILGFKIHAALQNPVGIPIAMSYYGTDGWKYTLQGLSNLRKGFSKTEFLKMAEVLRKYSPYYSERYGEGGFIQEFTSGLASGPAETRWRKSIEDKSLSWLEMTDKLGALARYKTAQAVIRDRTELKEGTPEFDRAVAREWNLMMFRSENTSHGADRTGYFQMAGRNPMFKVFIMFQSAVSKQYSMFAEAVIQAQQGGPENLKQAASKMSLVAASVYMSLAISSWFYGLLFPPDEEEEKDKNKMVRDALGGLISAPLSMVPVLGNTLQGMVAGWFSPENVRKPLQMDIISSFVFGTVDALNLAAKGIRQASSEEIDTKTGDPKWWNTSFKAIEKAANLAGIAFRAPVGGIIQSTKFVKQLAETTWDGINGDVPTDEEFQQKLQKLKRELAPQPATQEYAKLYFAVAENDQKKFNRVLRDLKEKNPNVTRDNIVTSIRRRPEFNIVTMVDRGTVKIGEHGITRDEYLSKKALRKSVEQAAIDMWRDAKSEVRP